MIVITFFMTLLTGCEKQVKMEISKEGTFYPIDWGTPISEAVEALSVEICDGNTIQLSAEFSGKQVDVVLNFCPNSENNEAVLYSAEMVADNEEDYLYICENLTAIFGEMESTGVTLNGEEYDLDYKNWYWHSKDVLSQCIEYDSQNGLSEYDSAWIDYIMETSYLVKITKCDDDFCFYFDAKYYVDKS